MNQKKMWKSVFSAAILLITSASLAQAQAVRTWVSGVGDDFNPCSRTAPCKTFAGAISKTAAGGEISVLDPGGFGGVTIAKSITINGEGALGGITTGAGHGITVMAGANDVVILKNLHIQGGGTGLSGIRFLTGGALHVQNVHVSGFNASPALGLDFTPSAASRLFIEDSTFRNNGIFASNTGGGIRILPSGAGGGAGVSMRNVTIDRNVTGMRVANGGSVFIRDSVIAGNSQNGLLLESTAGGAVAAFLDHVSVVANQLNGIVSSGTGAVARITNTTVAGNFATGLLSTISGQILSFGTNNNDGNGTDGNPTGSVAQQ